MLQEDATDIGNSAVNYPMEIAKSNFKMPRVWSVALGNVQQRYLRPVEVRSRRAVRDNTSHSHRHNNAPE
jgi:hypothetical protein